MHRFFAQINCRRRPASRCWLALLGFVTVLSSACQRGSPTSPSIAGSANLQAELSFCADQVNQYRASIGRSTLVRSQVLEEFAAHAAQNDGLIHLAHHLFSLTNGGGTSSAETEILWWRGFGVRGVIQKGLEQMWQNGPSAEHYDIIVGPYSEVGCRIFVNGSEVTVAQDFR